MKLSCPRQKLSQSLGAAARVAAKKTTMPILQSVLLEADDNGLKLSATDLETSIVIQMEAMVDDPGKVAVPAGFFNDLVRSFEDSNVMLELDVTKGTLTAKCGGAKSNVKLNDTDSFPPIAWNDGGTNVVLTPEALIKMINRTGFAVATDNNRPVLAGVQLSKNDDNYRAISTDGFQIAISNTDIENTVEDQLDVVIPAPTLGELSRLLNDQKDPVEINFNNQTVSFAMKGDISIELIAQLINSNYPNVDDVIPTNGFTAKMTLNVDDLQHAVRLSSLFAVYNSTKTIHFDVHIVDNNKGVMTVSNGSNDAAAVNIEIDADIEQFDNDEFHIAFNKDYIQKVLEVMNAEKEKQISLDLISHAQPGLFRFNSDRDEYLYLAMPVGS